MCVARHAQITQNNKCSISLQHGKKEVSHADDFLHPDKHESFLQIDTKIFCWGWSSIPRVPKMSLQYLKKEVRDEVDFLDADKHQSFLQVDINTWGIKVSYKFILSLLMGMIKHSQCTQSNKFAISLQYLKKEVRNGVHLLHADKHQNFYKLDYHFLWK